MTGLRDHRRQVTVIAAVLVLLLAAFAYWGPMGQSDGPLRAQADYGGWEDHSGVPVGFVIPVFNRGRSAAVLDGVQLVSTRRFAAPRLLRLELLAASPTPLGGACGYPDAAQPSGRGFRIAGCGSADAGPATGRPLAPTARLSPGWQVAAEVSPPPRGSCWEITQVTVHYRVGIFSYTDTDPYDIAVCTGWPQIRTAMHTLPGW
jgi:hypothetical protein